MPLCLTNKFSCWIFAKTSQFKSLSFENKYLVTYYLFLKIIIGYEHMQHLLVSKMESGEKMSDQTMILAKDDVVMTKYSEVFMTKAKNMCQFTTT